MFYATNRYKSWIRISGLNCAAGAPNNAQSHGPRDSADGRWETGHMVIGHYGSKATPGCPKSWLVNGWFPQYGN